METRADRLKQTLYEWTKRAEGLESELRLAKARYAEAHTRLKESRSRLLAAEQAREIACSVAQSIQEKTHSAIASVVSQCLSAVFENPYEFQILFEQKRGRTEANLVFERDGYQIDPMTASGGGAVDLAALALRLACLKLQRPASRPVLLLDEPFKNPSPQYRDEAPPYRERIKPLIEALSEEMGIQFIFVTNIMELCTGQIIDLEEQT